MSQKFKLLTETEFSNVEYNTEICEKTNSNKLYIEAITLQGNITNRNGRMYPEQVLDEAVNKYIDETNSLGMTMEGELKHPSVGAHEVNEERISHRFTELKKDGSNWVSKALILNTPCGKIVKI